MTILFQREAMTMSNENLPVYSNLAHILWQRGMTREELANALAIKPQTIGYIELGRVIPDLTLALRMSDILGVSVNEIFSLYPFPPLFGQPEHRLV
jgi:putative transcriptional regulator